MCLFHAYIYRYAGDASSPGGDASPRRHLLVKARCLDKQIQYIFLLPSWGIDPQLGNADARTRRPQVRTRRQRTYIYTRGISASIIYTRGIIPFMFFNTKRKIFVPIICSFKAEQVLLPCYSFPAKKSLKKFHSLSRWFTTSYAFRGEISQKFLPKTFGS